MEKLVTVITPTGSRPEAFALCEKYMKVQTYKGPLVWVVVDDSDPPTKCTLGQEYYRGPRLWEPGLNTQRFNMELALEKVKGDYILIWEDDENYQPTYIETYIHLLKTFDVVGEIHSRYYNLKIPGWKIMKNDNHVSLCQTGLRKEALPILKKAVDSGNLFIDVAFWDILRNSAPTNYAFFSRLNLAIGMKCMPGRPGIGVGHQQKDYYYDSNLSKLKEWLGKDAQNYEPFIKSTLKRRVTLNERKNGRNEKEDVSQKEINEKI